jgi:hypothetical protein
MKNAVLGLTIRYSKAPSCRFCNADHKRECDFVTLISKPPCGKFVWQSTRTLCVQANDLRLVTQIIFLDPYCFNLSHC